MKTIIPAAIFLLSFFFTNAQPDSILAHAKNIYRHESIFLHTDKNNYAAGETIWLKAYLHDGIYPSSQSDGLMVQLIGEDSALVSEKIYPVISGITNGDIELPLKLKTGRYFLRAFSNGGLHNKYENDFVTSIFIYNPSTQQIIKNAVYTINASVKLINPNKIVAGINNQLYVAVKDQYNQPVVCSGFLLTNTNDTVCNFITSAAGITPVKFIPSENKNYKILLQNNNEYDVSFKENNITNKGISINIDWKNGMYNVALESAGINAGEEYTLIAEYQYQQLFASKIKWQNGKSLINIPASQLPTGICRLVVLSHSGDAVCERFVFSKNKDAISETKNAVAVNTIDSVENKFSFSTEDTIEGSYSLSLFDLSYNFNDINKNENIVNRFFLTAWLKNNDPAYEGLIEKIDDADINTINGILATEQLQIPSWNEMVSEKNNNPAEIADENTFISISGKATPDGYKKFPANPMLGIVVATADSAVNYFTIPVKDDGKFELNNLLFTDTAKIYYKLNGKITRPVNLEISSASVKDAYSEKEKKFSFLKYYAPVQIITNQQGEKAFSQQQHKLFQTLLDTIHADKTLETVTVTTRLSPREKADEVDKKYTSAVFSGYAEKVIDFINNAQMNRPMNVIDYLKNYANIPRMVVTNSNIVKPVGWGNGMPYTLFLDEGITTFEALQSIDIRDVALIKVFQTNFVLANESGPALAVYTKKPGDGALPYNANIKDLKVAGYSSALDFINPDEENVQFINKKNAQSTLYWNPYLYTNKTSPSLNISFYNIHKAKNIQLVLQGIKSDGRIIYYTQNVIAQ